MLQLRSNWSREAAVLGAIAQIQAIRETVTAGNTEHYISVPQPTAINVRSLERCPVRADEEQAGEGFTLDFPARGYHLHGQSETTPFAERTGSMPIPGSTEDVGAMRTTSAFAQSLKNFTGTEHKRKKLEVVLTPFSGILVECPGRTNIL
ncbi:uncharacterized protein LOC142813916 [Rhipicephalus microplus]|uniref:uncharacterized protein LOC142813916 n=1 Tax=Rhipicephalus microplus TaxID=6941 RepID=UPI003F6BF461